MAGLWAERASRKTNSTPSARRRLPTFAKPKPQNVDNPTVSGELRFRHPPCYPSRSMSAFIFRSWDGSEAEPREWLRVWADRYPSNDYAEYNGVIVKHKSFSAADFAQIGKWKDAAKTEGKWKANVASVAYPIWMQAASELPKCPQGSAIADFLADWSARKYTDEYASGPVEKRFGLSRTTTLLHFISGGHFPIFDSRVRRAMTRLLSSPVPNSVRWYLDSYCPLFSEVATLCGTEDLRIVDMALFSYGDRILPFK